MKTFYLSLISLIFSLTLFGQSPNKFTFQSIVRDSESKLVTMTSVGMQISILQYAVDGVSVYTEVQNPSSNINGLVTIEIGEGTTTDDFGSVDWSDGPYFIRTEIDPAGGISYTISGTSQLLSVPYALHANTAERISGTLPELDPTYSASEAANITSHDIAKLDSLSGTNTGDQDLSALVSIEALNDSSAQIRAAVIDSASDIREAIDTVYSLLHKMDNFTAVEAIEANALDIKTNATTISDNTTDISTNQQALIDSSTNIRADVLINSSDITTNTTDITNNAIDVSNNQQAIIDSSTNIRADILSSVSNITTNTTDITNNAIDISNNQQAIIDSSAHIRAEVLASASDITTNTNAISKNATDISINQQAVIDSSANIRSEILANASDITTNTTDISTNEQAIIDSFANIRAEINPSEGTPAGQMQYWDGTQWSLIAPTYNSGANLHMIGGVPTWVVPTFIDARDGSEYEYVEIGTQTWMAENLNFSGNIGGSTRSNNPTYGWLYDFEAAKVACPSGWHLPSDDEWSILIKYIGHVGAEGTILKSTTGWNNDGNGENYYGFSALPGGDDDSSKRGTNGYWWSSTENSSGPIYYGLTIDVSYSSASVDSGNFYSVRCVKD